MIGLAPRVMSERSFFTLLKKRRSIRAFKTERFPAEKLVKILEAANLAPSSGGLQTFEIYQVKSRELKDRLAVAAKDQIFLSEAPILLVFCANPSRSVERFGERSNLFSVQDATIAAAYSQLTVEVLGLSTTWVGNFDENKVSEILGLPAGHRPVAILPIGLKNEKPKEKTTRGAKDLFHVID